MSAERRILSGNERMVVDLLLDRGPPARPSIARATSMSRPATSDLVARLLDRGLVEEAGERETGQRGPNAMTYRVRSDLARVVGVEMQPSYVRVALADLTGRVLAEADGPLAAGQPAVESVVQAIRTAADAAGIRTSELSGAVIGTPGVVGPAGDIDFVSGHEDWGEGQRARLVEALGAPVRLENDANLAAIAEQRLGAARDVRSFVLVRCDEGVGAAVVVGGTLLRGAHGYAGELGYVPLGRPYGRPEDGFQSLVARAVLAELLDRSGVDDATPEDMLADPDLHPAANAAFLAEVAERFALLCVTLCAVLDPERIVLSGTVVVAGADRLTDAITRRLHEMSPMRPSVAVTAVGDGAVVAGALATALDAVRDEVFGTTTDRDLPSEGGG